MKLKIILPIIIMTLSVVGCVKTNNTDKIDETKNVSTTEIQQLINDSNLLVVEPVMEMAAKDHPIFESVKDLIEDGFVNQAMINVKLQDVIFIKTSDTDAIVKVIEEYKNNNLKMFGDGYGGEENIEAVANSILEVKGDYVYFIATPNAKDIETEILKSFE